jgi:hypothetical protein
MIRLLLGVILVASSHTHVSVVDLDGDPEAWDGEKIAVTGEIIGDHSRRSDVVWVQLNDDAYTETPLAERPEPAGGNTGIGVRIPLETFDEAWGKPGGYDIRGPIVEVQGIFRYNSPNDQGATFLEATSIELVAPARPIERRPASTLRAFVGLLLTLTGGGLWWFELRMRAPSRG